MNTNKLFIIVIAVCIFALNFRSMGQILFKYDTPYNLANKLINTDSSGIKILNVNYLGDSKSIAAYYSSSAILPVKNGIVLCTGIAERAGYSNETSNAGTARFTPGDERLESIAGDFSTDAAILEIWFLANSDRISFQYFFASEEYPEFVNKGVNDVFAFFIEGPGFAKPYNMAFLPENHDPITVDHINAEKNSQYYIANQPLYEGATDLASIFQYDGLTTILEASANIEPYKPYKLTLAIADIGDNVYDSGVFIKMRSFSSNGLHIPLKKELTNELKAKSDIIDYIGFRSNGDTLNFNKLIRFDFNSYDIQSDDTLALDAIISIMKKYFDSRIKLIGHTDETGTRDYNYELSVLRAKAVANYFIDNGIKPSRIIVLGKGKQQPIDRSGTGQAQKNNRRVEFLIY